MTTPRRAPDQSVRSLLENAERRGRPDRRRSRKLFFLLILPSLVLALVGGGAFLGYSLGWRLPFLPVAGEDDSPAPAPATAPATGAAVAIAEKGAAPPAPAALVPSAASTDRIVRNPSLNFQFAVPAAPWKETKADAIDPKAVLSIAREDPECIFTIVADKPGTEASLDSEQAAELSKIDLERVARAGGLGKTESVRIHGLKAARFQCDHAKTDPPMTSIHSVLAHNGYMYKLVTFGREADRAAIAVAADELAGRFQLIDRFRTALARDDSFGVFESPRFGYRLDLKDTPWRQWPGFSLKYPIAETGAAGPGKSGVMVIPLYLMGATVETQVLAAAMIARASSFREALPEMRITKEGDCEVVTFPSELTSPSAGLLCRFKLVRNRAYACFIAAWTDRHSVEGRRAIEDVINRVTINFPVEPLDTASFNQRERECHGTLFNEFGVHYDNKGEHRRALGYYRAAAALLPDEPVINSNFAEVLWRVGDFKDALSFLEKSIPRFPQNHQLRVLQARVLVDLGRTNDAKDAYSALFRTGYQNDNDFVQFVELLLKTGDFERGIKEIANYLRRDESPKIVQHYGLMLIRAGRSTEAIGYLSKYLKDKPWNDVIAMTLIVALRTSGRPQEALPVIDRLIKEGARPAEAYKYKGHTEFDLKQYAKAKESFAMALKYDPANAELRKALDITKSILGQRDSTAVRKPIDAVELPGTLTTGKRLEVASVRGAGYDAYYELSLDATEFIPSKLHRRTRRFVLHVLEPSAVAQFNLIQVPFDSRDVELFVHRLEVFDSAGKKTGAGDAANYYLTDSGGAEANDRKMLNMPVPGLLAGSRIELSYTIRSALPPARLPLVVGMHARRIPVGRSVVAVRATPDSLAIHQVLSPPPQRDGDLCVWSAESIFPTNSEALADPDHPTEPIVLVGDRADTWKDVGVDYLTLVADRLKPDPQIHKLAQSLVKDKTTNDEKVLALARYVQREYTYLAIEFGQRAYVMNPPAQIVREKYGDCKDHAALLYHLLHAVGIPAHLALVKAGGRLYPEVPSLGQFNHLVVYLPNWRGGRYIDCTNKQHDPDLPVPIGQIDRPALVLDPNNPRLVRAADYPPDAFQLDVERELRPDGADLIIRETLKLSLYNAVSARFLFGLYEADGRSHVLRDQLLSVGTNPNEVSVEAQNLDRAEGPVVLRNSFRVVNVLHEVDGKWVGRLPLFWEAGPFTLSDSRLRPVPLKVPAFLIRVNMRLTAPQGYTLVTVPAVSEDGPYASVSRTSRVADGAVDLTWTLRRIAGRFPSDKYPELRGAYRRVHDALNPTITFTKP